MKIRSHSESHIVELDDGSRWQIFPGDLDLTLNWKPETEITVAPVEEDGAQFARADRRRRQGARDHRGRKVARGPTQEGVEGRVGRSSVGSAKRSPTSLGDAVLDLSRLETACSR
jgi:hypothetical protein